MSAAGTDPSPLVARVAKISRHARDQWDERGDGSPISEAFALAAHAEYTLPDGKPAYPGAQTFMYAPGHLTKELVFIVRNSTVVTVTPARGRAIASRNLSACPCCDGVHELVADCGCVWCNKKLERLQRLE